MDVNLYIASSILLRGVSLFLLIFFVIPKQIKELRLNTGRYVGIAKLLLTMIMIFVLTAFVPLSYQTTRLETDGELSFQNAASVATNIGNLAFVIGWVALYNQEWFIRSKNWINKKRGK